MATADQYCTFRVDDLLFGVEVLAVQEVLRHQEMTPVPQAPACVRGLINLRGQIVTALDLRSRLRLPGAGPGTLPMNVVVRSRDEVVSLLVDDIGDVVDTTGLPLEPAPVIVPAPVREVLDGVVALPDAILLVLDPDRAADVPADAPSPAPAQPVPSGGTL